ncbi:MAG: hypothetical protein ACRD5L_07600 [Bryobacteraceae bacterium]
MPVLEAMAAGLNVACSRIPPLEEVGGDVVQYFDPLSEDDIRQALRRLATGPSAAPPEAQARALGFTWERAARETLDCLMSAGPGRPAPARPAALLSDTRGRSRDLS